MNNRRWRKWIIVVFSLDKTYCSSKPVGAIANVWKIVVFSFSLLGFYPFCNVRQSSGKSGVSYLYYSSRSVIWIINNPILLFLPFPSLSDKVPVEATFRGVQYLSYDLSRGDPIISNSENIKLSFKTRRPSGLLFYTGEKGWEGVGGKGKEKR